MQRNKMLSGFLTMTGLALMLLLAGCGDTPPTIDFITPEGQVIDWSLEENHTQTIEGTVVTGTSSVSSLSVGGETVPIETDGYFSYDYVLDDTQDDLFSICTFLLKDTKGIQFKERMVFIRGAGEDNIGEPAQHDPEYVRNAVNVVVNAEMINVAAQAAQDMVNNHMEALLAGSGMLPIPVDTSVADAEIDVVEITGLQLGEIYLREPTGGMYGSGSIQIGATEDPVPGIQIEEIYVSGRMNVFLVTWGWQPFYARITPKAGQTNAITMDELKMEVYYDSADKDIDVRFNFIDVGDEYFDTLNVNTWIHNPWNGQFELKTGLNEEGWNKLLFNGISKTLNFTFMDVRYLGLNYATDILGFEDNTIFGIPIPPMPLDIAAWFPEGYIYYVDADRQEMNLHLGLAINPINDPAVNPDAVPSPNPIGHYYSTPGDELPVLDTEEGNNLTIGLNDDVINMGAWAAMEAGGFDGLNITSQFRYITGQALANSVFRKAVAKVYMQAPPIADFSGSGYTESYPDGDGIVSNAGTFRIRDMIIEVTDLLANQINDRAILSIDTDVNINLRLSEDGKRIEGYMGSQSMMNIATLYYGNVELTNLVSLAPAITDYVTDLAIRALLKFNVPKIETYDANIQPEISSISVGDNNMIVKLNITRPEITE